MLIKKATVVFFGCTLFLFGCTVVETLDKYEETTNDIKKDYHEIVDQMHMTDKTPFVRKFNKVYVSHLTKEEISMPDWYGVKRFASGTQNIELIKLLQSYFAAVSYTHLTLPTTPYV